MLTPPRRPGGGQGSGILQMGTLGSVEAAGYRASDSFDPAILDLSGWWQASYTASPWVGTASAGASGGRQMSDAVAPTSGTTVNGFAPAVYNGTTQKLVYSSGGNLSALFNKPAAAISDGSLWVVFKAGTLPVHSGTLYTNPPLFSDNSTGFVLSYDDSGLNIYIDTSVSGARSVSIAASLTTTTWHLAQVKFSVGVGLFLRLDGGLWSSTTMANPLRFDNTPARLGHYWVYANCQQLEVGTSKQVLSDATFDQILSACRSRYAQPF